MCLYFKKRNCLKLNKKPNNIASLKLFIKLLLNENVDNDYEGPRYNIDFLTKYYEYKCDDCLIIGAGNSCSCCKKSLQSTIVNIKGKSSVCCKCSSFEKLKNNISFSDTICVNDFYPNE